MDARDRTWWAALGAIFVLLVVWVWFRLGQAGDAQDAAWASIRQQRADVVRLQAMTQSLGGSSQSVPATDLLAVVQEVLTRVDVSPEACTGLQPGTGTRADRIRMQELGMTGLSPSELGAWCAAWAQRRTGWRIVSLVWRTGIAEAGTTRLDGRPAQVRISLASAQAE